MTKLFAGPSYIQPRVKATCPVNDEFINLKENIHEFSLKGKIILMGDFNARSGTLNKFVEFDHITRVDNEFTNYLEDIILPICNNVDEIIMNKVKTLDFVLN